MSPDEIPAAMVEAAARAVHEHGRLEFDEPEWEQLTDAARDSYRKAERLALVAALSVCQVRGEQGVRSVREGDVFGQPGAMWSARSWLAARSYSQPGAVLIRRLVITTPAQPVTDNEGEQR